jgi:hypothetical protein
MHSEDLTGSTNMQASGGGASQNDAIKQVVACACTTRAANISNPSLEDKEIFLTRMQAKVKKGAVALPPAVVSHTDIKLV